MSGQSNNHLRQLLAERGEYRAPCDAPRIPDFDELLEALRREHGPDGRPDEAPQLAKRDFKGKQFEAVLPFRSASEIFLSDGKYLIGFGAGRFVSDVDCIVTDNAVMARVADWSKGDKIKVTGVVQDVSIGSVALDSCSLSNGQASTPVSTPVSTEPLLAAEAVVKEFCSPPKKVDFGWCADVKTHVVKARPDFCRLNSNSCPSL
jgi:hypothetical protein